MTDSINDQLREVAAKFPPPDPQQAAQKRRENHDAWEVVAIPKLFEHSVWMFWSNRYMNRDKRP